MTTINSAEIDRRVAEIARKIDKTQRAETMAPALKKAGEHVTEIMREEPRKAAGAFTRLATPAQRRAYWARVRSGEARHSDSGGYIREGSAKRWFYRASKTRVTIEQPVAYANYVWGTRQQPFHAASRWPQGDDVLEREGDTIVGFFEAEARRVLNG